LLITKSDLVIVLSDAVIAAKELALIVAGCPFPEASVKVIFGDTGTEIVSHPAFNCPSNS
jgi:hypothetical protein